MREHQIVISLKPEQFQEVQKQARAAGAQSVGAFVRQNLLNFLGLEESINAGKASQMSPSVQADPDWRFIAGELRRLHRELKVLSSEATVSNTLVTDIAGSNSSISGPTTATGGPLLASTVALSEPYREPVPEYSQPAQHENFLTDGAPIAVDDYSDNLDDSLILPPAHGITGGGTTPFFQTPTMPSRSPFGMPMSSGLPLSSPFSQHAFMPNISPLPSDLGIAAQAPAKQEFTVDEGDPVETTKIEAKPQQPAETQPIAQPTATETAAATPQTSAQSASQLIPQPTSQATFQTASQDPQVTQAAQPVSQPDQRPAAAAQLPPANAPQQPPAVQQPVAPPQAAAPVQPEAPTITPVQTRSQIASQTPAEQPGAFAPQKDDMEVLADRAFAISPRLGAIEPEVTLQPAQSRSFADTLEELLDAGLINQVLSQTEVEEDNPYAGEVEAPPEDDLVQVIVQEVDVPSPDATDSKNTEESDNTSNSEPEDSQNDPPAAIQHDPPPPPRPIGGADQSGEDEPPKPPPRRRKLM